MTNLIGYHGVKKLNYNIGIIGYGNMADYHVRKIPRPSSMCFTKAYDVSPTSLSRARRAGLSACEHVEELLSDPFIDIVLVATPPVFHYPYGKKVLEADKHLILEKPATMNAEELSELIVLAERKGKLITVHQNRRNDADFLAIQTLVREGQLGKVFRLESRIQGSRGIADTWRRIKSMGGGMLYDWGSHLIDHILELTQGTVTQVWADFQYLGGYDVDDNVRVTMLFDDGVSALVEIGTCNLLNLPVWYVAGQTGTAMIREWAGAGEYARFTNKRAKQLNEIPDSKVGPSITFAPCQEDLLQKLPLPIVKRDEGKFYKNLLLTLEGKEDLWIKPQECLRTAKIIDAAFASGEQKKSITCNI